MNQKTLEIFYQSQEIKMNEKNGSELQHHGVLGMSWGDRNGPPYPLSGANKKIARAEAKRKKEQERRLEKMREAAAKKRKERVKAQKKQDKLAVKQAKKEEKVLKKKQELVKKGDMYEIRKNAKIFTNEELQYLNERDEAVRAAKTAKLINNLKTAGTVAAGIGNIFYGLDSARKFMTDLKLDNLKVRDKKLDLTEKNVRVEKALTDLKITMAQEKRSVEKADFELKRDKLKAEAEISKLFAQAETTKKTNRKMDAEYSMMNRQQSVDTMKLANDWIEASEKNKKIVADWTAAVKKASSVVPDPPPSSYDSFDRSIYREWYKVDPSFAKGYEFITKL